MNKYFKKLFTMNFANFTNSLPEIQKRNYRRIEKIENILKK